MLPLNVQVQLQQTRAKRDVHIPGNLYLRLHNLILAHVITTSTFCLELASIPQKTKILRHPALHILTRSINQSVNQSALEFPSLNRTANQIIASNHIRRTHYNTASPAFAARFLQLTTDES